MGYAFISYSTQNQPFADAVRNLFNKHGIDTWMAPYDIPVGSIYAAVITKAIRECSCFVLLLSNDSQASPAVNSEVELAALTYKKSIITIEIEKVVLNDAFTFYVHNKQIIALRKIDEASTEIKEILGAVSAYTSEKRAKLPIDNSDGQKNTKSEGNISTCQDNLDEIISDLNSNNETIETKKSEKPKDTAIVACTSEEQIPDEISTHLNTETISFGSGNTNDKIDGNQSSGDPILADKPRGHLEIDHKKAKSNQKEYCKNPIEICLPDESVKVFSYCDKYTLSSQKRYIIVSQSSGLNECAFYVLRCEDNRHALAADEYEQKKVYRWFKSKHAPEYIFTDSKPIPKGNTPKKKKFFAADTALRYFATSQNIPQVLIIPSKYNCVSSLAFSKLITDNKEIRQIIIPKSIQAIDKAAFEGLVVTEAVFIPNTVKRIGENAFTLKNGAFVYCEYDSYAYKKYVNSGVNVIVDTPFKTKFSEPTAIMHELFCVQGITRIKSKTIRSKDYIEVDSLTIPDGVCIIDNNSLFKIKIKEKVVIPTSVLMIGENALNLMPDAYVVCGKDSYAYFYCKENGIKNSVDISNQYKANGLCANCGGRFSGILKKKCCLCGQEKDY